MCGDTLCSIRMENTMKTTFISAALLAVCATFAQAESHAMDMPMAHEVVLGDLTVSDAFTRATLPNAPVAGGFLNVMNNGTVDDRLISAITAISKDTQIHEMAMDGDVMKMRELPGGLPVPAGQTVTLAPGGYHLMFMGLNGPLLEGETITVRLMFEVAGEVDVQLPVGASNQRMIGHGEMKMGDMPAASE
ncbi:MAG: copper chaperone PCu(A)C [Yoonia sp.]|nr:copper chaperone PCu(A)C [Yoonia sp.]